MMRAQQRGRVDLPILAIVSIASALMLYGVTRLFVFAQDWKARSDTALVIRDYGTALTTAYTTNYSTIESHTTAGSMVLPNGTLNAVTPNNRLCLSQPTTFAALGNVVNTGKYRDGYGTVSYTHLTLPTNREV